MNKIFPPMYSKPEKIQLFALIPCWIWVFVLVPMFMPFVGLGVWDQEEISVWLEVVYHVINGVVIMLVIGGYLKDEWFMVTTDARHYLKHVLLTVVLMIGAELALMGALHLCGINYVYTLECLPVAEMSVIYTPRFLVILEPVFGAIVLSVFAPISICGLFYCFAFAPICNKKPWLAYLCVAVILLIPPVIDILWRDEAVFYYIAQLPIHLLACWSYQKTDNLWTPMVSIAVFNLIASVVLSNPAI